MQTSCTRDGHWQPEGLKASSDTIKRAVILYLRIKTALIRLYLLHQIFRYKASHTSLIAAMDMQMIIPIATADTPEEARTIPLVVSRTNISPLSYAVIRDHKLLEDLQSFAKYYGLALHGTFPTGLLIHYLLSYQRTFRLRLAADIRVKNAIKILEIAWSADIRDWSEHESLSPKHPITGETIWRNWVRLFKFILLPLRTRTAYIFFNEEGDIGGNLDAPGIWRHSRFHGYGINNDDKTLELQFKVDNQIKGLVLQIDEIEKFDDFRIYFQHPTHPDCILFSPFSLREFAAPRPDSNQRRNEIMSEILNSTLALGRKKLASDKAEVCINDHAPDFFPPLLVGSDVCIT
jgi:hypothetical protein